MRLEFVAIGILVGYVIVGALTKAYRHRDSRRIEDPDQRYF